MSTSQNVFREKRRFLRQLTNTEIAASSKQKINLSALQQEFGLNFNTLSILNLDDSNINLELDGNAVATIQGSNGSFGFDGRDGLSYNEITLENLDSGGVVSSGNVKITVGRTAEES